MSFSAGPRTRVRAAAICFLLLAGHAGAYRPGSTVFLVWQRQQEEEVAVGDFDFGRDLDALWRSSAHNRFIVKVNYWLGL